MQGVSAATSFPLEEILEEKNKLDTTLPSPMGMVYQIYIQNDRERTKELIREAVEGGVQ